jgi:hypothetical protein
MFISMLVGGRVGILLAATLLLGGRVSVFDGSDNNTAE